jgi:hypothetical protein
VLIYLRHGDDRGSDGVSDLVVVKRGDAILACTPCRFLDRSACVK